MKTTENKKRKEREKRAFFEAPSVKNSNYTKSKITDICFFYIFHILFTMALIIVEMTGTFKSAPNKHNTNDHEEQGESRVKNGPIDYVISERKEILFLLSSK